MSRKNLFTGQPQPPAGEAPKPLSEPIATLLARAQALNPVPHQSGPRGFSGLGAGRRNGRLTRGRAPRERVRGSQLFGIRNPDA